MDAHFFDEGQLPDLKNDDFVEEEDTEDMELDGIDVVTGENTNVL